jgi:hypothetical protein
MPAGTTGAKSGSSFSKNWWALAVVGVLVIGGLLVLQRSGGSECGGVPRVEIDGSARASVTGAEIERFCFIVVRDGEPLDVLVSSDGDPIMEIFWNGDSYAFSDDENGLDPAIYGVFAAGVYIAAISNYDADAPRTNFTIAIRS